MRNSIYFLFFVLFYSANSEKAFLPPYITPCNYRDNSRSFEKCVQEQVEKKSLPYFAKGIPELGVPSLDPVNLENVIINGNGLNLSIADTKMYGLSNSKVKLTEINLEKEIFSLEVITDLKATGQYKINGQILILPVQGDGDTTILVKNVKFNINCIFKYDNLNDHFKLDQPTYKYHIGQTIFKFDNLFGGNKEISDTTHKFANENWEQLMDDLAPPVIQQIVKTCVKAINKFLSRFSASQIIPGYKPH